MLYIAHCQVAAKFCKDYESHTVSARRDCIFIIALPWGHVNTPLGLSSWSARTHNDTMCHLLLPSNAHALGYIIIPIAWQSHAVWLI